MSRRRRLYDHCSPVLEASHILAGDAAGRGKVSPKKSTLIPRERTSSPRSLRYDPSPAFILPTNSPSWKYHARRGRTFVLRSAGPLANSRQSQLSRSFSFHLPLRTTAITSSEASTTKMAAKAREGMFDVGEFQGKSRLGQLVR